jgi:hypothetical protein
MSNIAENCRKSLKIVTNHTKYSKVAENCRKSKKIVIITSTPWCIPALQDWGPQCRECRSRRGNAIEFSGRRSRVARWFKHFQTKTPNLGKILEGLAMEDIGIFYVHLVYFTAFWYILWTLRTLSGYLVYFSRFGMLQREKSGNPAENPYFKIILEAGPTR